VHTLNRDKLAFSLSDVSRLLGISRTKIHDFARTGQIPTIRFGRRVVVPRHALMALLGEDENSNWDKPATLPELATRTRVTTPWIAIIDHFVEFLRSVRAELSRAGYGSNTP
jgi:excisionase family DNA binding protein